MCRICTFRPEQVRGYLDRHGLRWTMRQVLKTAAMVASLKAGVKERGRTVRWRSSDEVGEQPAPPPKHARELNA
jgi:hypothetical protein